MNGNDSEEDSKCRSDNESEQPSKESVGAKIRAAIDTVPPTQRRLAEAIVLALYFWHEAHSDWPVSHGGALFYGAVGTCAVLLIELPFKWWLAASAAIAAGCYAAFLVIGPVVQSAAPTEPIARPSPDIGWLQPGTEPTPPNSCDNEPTTDKDSVLILAGGNAFRAIAPLNQFAAVAVGWCPLLVQKTENGLALSTTIFDRDGEELGSLVNNKFKITKEHGVVTERSGDLTTLVVHDSKDVELLYVRYLNPKAIRIRGTFSCPQPRLRTVTITDRTIQGAGIQNTCFGGGGSGIGIYIP